MSFQTAGRYPDRKQLEPFFEKSGNPIVAQYYSGQLICQDSTQGGQFRPYVLGLTGSVIVGVNKSFDFNVTAAIPFPEGMITVQAGSAIAFANDPAASGSVSATTAPGTILWAIDDQTVSTVRVNGNVQPAGRLFFYDNLNPTYPVFVKDVGLMPSGTLA